MPLHVLDHSRVTDDFKQVFISYEVESGKVGPLLFEVLSEGFLYHLEGSRESAQHLLEIGYLHYLKDDGCLGNLLHQTGKVSVDVLESIELVRQHRLNVSRSKEDALQVHVSALHINPVIKCDPDLLQSLGPGLNVLLKDLVVGTHLHRVDVVHVILTQLEKLIPALDQLGFVLVVDQLQLLGAPCFLDGIDEVLENRLTSGLRQDILNNLALAKNVGIPQVADLKVLELDLNMKFAEQIFPVLWLHAIVSKVEQHFIELLVVLEVVSVHLVDLVGAHACWELAHLVCQSLECFLHCLVDVHLEGSLLNLVDYAPYFLGLLPDLKKVAVVLLHVIEVVRVTKLHLEKFLRVANLDKLLDCCLDLLAKDRHLVDSFFDLWRSVLREVICLLRSVISPLNFNFLGFPIHDFLFFKDLLLKGWNLFLHR